MRPGARGGTVLFLPRREVLLCLLMGLFFIPASPLSAGPQLSPGEAQELRPVSVLCPDFENFFSRSRDGEYHGYGYELLLAAAQEARWKVNICGTPPLPAQAAESAGPAEAAGSAVSAPDIHFTRRRIGEKAPGTSPGRRILISAGGYSYSIETEESEAGLLAAWDSAMQALTSGDIYFFQRLYQKFYGESDESPVLLTEKEKAYIRGAGTVLVSYDPAWFPLSYRGRNGQFAGSIRGIYGRISERTGLRFDFRGTDTYTDALRDFKSGRTQLMAELPYDFAWAEKHHANITPPFTTLTILAACRSSGPTGSRAALPSGYYQQYLSSTIRSDNYSFVNFPTIEGCLNATLSGRADFTLLNLYQVEYYRGTARYHGMFYKVLPGYEYDLAIAVSQSADPRLLSIISKALRSIGSNEINSILRESSADSLKSRSLLDIIYANPMMALVLFSLCGFLVAAAIGGMLYASVLKRKNMQLSEAMKAKSTFLSNMSHDMRTPLNGILGFTSLALDADNREEARGYLEKIMISGNLLKDLITDTLDISRIESGKYLLAPEPVKVHDLLEEVLVPIRSAAEARKIKLVVDEGGLDSLWVNIGVLSARKILLNLLSNAVKFTPENGTVQLLLSRLDPPAGRYNCRVVVSDTGMGISKAFLPYLFEPFSQERHSATTTGTGLGLSIVKRLVGLMGGTISVESEQNRGSVFTVLLPVSAIQPPPEESHAGPDIPAFRGRRLLLCEDNALNREIAEALLGKEGFEVDCAEDGRAGLEKFRQSIPGFYSAVLMDLRMPVMDGYAATAAIRALDRADAASIPIIAMTADAYSEDIRRCLSSGMNGHVSKPVNAHVLIAEIARCMGQISSDMSGKPGAAQ